MAQEIKQGNIFGRIGTGFGRGLAEQIPKEVERNRLSSGLQQLEKDLPNLSPTQQLIRLYSIPGNTPQMIQSFGDLARQQARGQALTQASRANEKQSNQSPFPQRQNNAAIPGSETPSITQAKPLEEIQKGYIPPTREEIDNIAGDAYNKNPDFFGHDPQKALNWAESKAAQEEKINLAYKQKNEDLSKIQDNVVGRLKTHSDNLKVNIPANVYKKLESEAIKSVKPKEINEKGENEGGDGLTEEQAITKVGGKLDAISRDYESINSLGNWGITQKSANETLSSLKALQKKFDLRNDTENFGDRLISEKNLSPIFGYSIAEPVSRNNEINQVISALPSVKSRVTAGGGLVGKDFSKVLIANNVKDKTSKVSEKLAPLLRKDKNASPLAIAYELQKKGYDISVLKNYLIDHKDELKLSAEQERQLDKPWDSTGTLNDWWLQSWSGLDKTREKK